MRILSLALTMVLCGCAAQTAAPVAAPSPTSTPAQVQPVMRLAVTPADSSAGLPISTEINLDVSDGDVRSVALTDQHGQTVAGRIHSDGTRWVPDQPLRGDTTYTATVVAQGVDRSETVTRTFTTMPVPGHRIGTGLYLFDGEEYGVAMPVVVEFVQDVTDREGVQKRLFAESDPPQPGVWHWTGPRQVTYRAEKYWQPGTTIRVRAALDGHPMGDGRFGDTDRRATVHIAQKKVELFIDNATKHMTVREDGTETRQMPVSLGKPSTPSSSGTMVIMEKKAQTVFDTTGEPGDQYRVDISYAQRLTWGGEFIHAAPWSVADQGVNNVSHGCVNMSWSDAEWLFQTTHVGDPVTVTGTEQQLEPGNGFTAWNVPWPEYVKGSALPVR